MTVRLVMTPVMEQGDGSGCDAPETIEIEVCDGQIRCLRGNPSLLRLLLRDLEEPDYGVRCETQETTLSDGTTDTVRYYLPREERSPHDLLVDALILNRGGYHRIAGVMYYVSDIEESSEVASEGIPLVQTEIGPQSKSDRAFTARMRFHQSWYRAHVLRAPYGTGPNQHDTRLLGNMLTVEDAAVGMNFTSHEAFAVAQERMRSGEGVVEEYRLLHNMLSSQPFCFSLFGPLCRDLEWATWFLGVVLGPHIESEGGPFDRYWGDGWPISQVVGGRIEYAPQPAREYLNDHTAFDAFFEFETEDGSLGFVGIETKLTEPFSSGTPDKPEYRRWMKGEPSPWLPEARERVNKSERNQLWRDHLLAVALRDHPRSPYKYGCLLLLRHPDDHHCGRVAARYKELLNPEDPTFLEVTLDQVIDQLYLWGNLHGKTPCLDGLRMRYLALEQSDGAWREAVGPRRGRRRT